jgi:ketosteroid isomerase-like protein
VVRRQFEAFVSGGLDAVAEFWSEEIEWRAVEGALDDVGVMRGPDAVRAYYEGWTHLFDDLRAEVVEVLYEDGARVAVAVRNSGRGRSSTAPTAGRYYVACVVRGGRIVAGREYLTPEEAVTAATRLEPGGQP